MPAGTALAPGAVPGGLAGLGGLPEGEIQRIFLFFARRHARARKQFIQAAAGKFAVGRVGAHPEVDVARRRGVGRALGDQLGAKLLDLGDIFRGARFQVRAQHPQAVHVFMKGVDIGLGHFLPVAAFLVGAVDDLVVHIRKIAHKGDFQAQMAQMADQCIEHQGGTGVADMAVVIGGDAADVHMHFARPDRNEFFFLTAQSIVNLHDDPLGAVPE